MGRRPGPSSLAGLSVTVLEKELRRRAKSLRTLERKRDKLAKKLASLDAQIAASGGSSARGRRSRPQNSMTLVQAMEKSLAGKTLGVTELANAVKKDGYSSHAANFRTIVNQALIKHRKVFKKVSRGQYTTA